VPGHGASDGADAHGEDCRVGEPVDQAQAGHRQPARGGKLQRAQPLRPGPDGGSGIADGAPQQPARAAWYPCGASFERAAQLWPARGGRDPDEDRCGQHAARDRDGREQDFPGRQPGAGRDERRSRRRDHPAGQQRPAGEGGVRALPGESAVGEGRGQLGSGQRNRDRHRVGRVGGGQHGPDTDAGATRREQAPLHDREGGHGRRFEQDGGQDPGPPHSAQQGERRRHDGPLGHSGGRQRCSGADGDHNAGPVPPCGTPRPSDSDARRSHGFLLVMVTAC
jgi:hypothetical protein